MACQSEELSAGLGVPQLARPVVAARDEPGQSRLHVASLVERAVGERLLVGLESLEQLELLVLVLDDLGLQFCVRRRYCG